MELVEVGPGAPGHLGQGVIDVVVISGTHGDGKQAKAAQHCQMGEEQRCRIREETKHDTGQQRHEYISCPAHILRAHHEEHALLEVGVEIDVPLETEGVEDLMGEQTQEGKSRANSKSAKKRCSAAEEEGNAQNRQQGEGNTVGNAGEGFGVLRLPEFYGPGLVFPMGQRVGIEIEFSTVMKAHEIISFSPVLYFFSSAIARTFQMWQNMGRETVEGGVFMAKRAARMEHFSISPSAALMAKVTELRAQGKDIISLNVGEPDFETPAHIRRGAEEALSSGFTHYTTESGIPELRRAIARKLKEENGVEYGMNEITVTVGAKQAIFCAMMTLVQAGDEVLLPVPCWVSYTEMIRLAGATPVFVPVREDNYELDLDAIESAITPRTKAIVICTPNNPTGAVYSEESLRRLGDLAEEHDFFIVSDEIYEKLIYGEKKHFSVASVSPALRDRTVTVNGFSKAYAMTGWRIGYAAAREDIIKGIIAMQSQTTSCTNTLAQKGALAALEGPQEAVKTMRDEFCRRGDFVVRRLREMEGIRCPDVHGAFYVYPDVSAYFGKRWQGGEITDAVTLCQYLLDEALVAAVPGEAFNGPGKIRISYSNSMENLERAMSRMEGALKRLT